MDAFALPDANSSEFIISHGDPHRARQYFSVLMRGTTRALIGLLVLAAGPAMADWSALNMPTGVTEVSQIVYDLHMLIFWICVVIGVGVFGVLFYSVLMHRKSRGVTPATHFHESTTIEVIWTVIPFIILVAMAVPATATLLQMEDSRNPELTIKITGYQWLWRYDYLDHNTGFYSYLATPREAIEGKVEKSEHYLLEVDRPMVIPTSTKIRLLLTANDVLHAWWVPDLALKKDAIPGFINEMWTKVDVPGIYRGQCAELCGRDHGFMPIEVHAVSPDEFNRWINQQTATP